jgi:flavodoxin
MNALVLYDSESGDTEQLAKEIAGTLQGYGRAQVMPADDPSVDAVATADLLVVGVPTSKHGLTPTMRGFLNRMPPGALLGKQVAVFDTRQHAPRIVTGSAAHDLGRRLKGMGADLVVSPKSFFLAGKDGRLYPAEPYHADRWAEVLLEKAEQFN